MNDDLDDGGADGDMDPEAAAAYATDDVDAGAGSRARFSSGGLGGGGPFDRLFDGDAPGPSVGEIETDYGISKDWAIFTRGAVRTATGSGIPPIVEIVAGGAMGLVRAARDRDDGSLGQLGATSPGDLDA